MDFSVKGYSAAASEQRGNLMDTNVEQETIRELNQRKQVRIFVISLTNVLGWRYMYLVFCYST